MRSVPVKVFINFYYVETLFLLKLMINQKLKYFDRKNTLKTGAVGV